MSRCLNISFEFHFLYICSNAHGFSLSRCPLCIPSLLCIQIYRPDFEPAKSLNTFFLHCFDAQHMYSSVSRYISNAYIYIFLLHIKIFVAYKNFFCIYIFLLHSIHIFLLHIYIFVAQHTYIFVVYIFVEHIYFIFATNKQP